MIDVSPVIPSHPFCLFGYVGEHGGLRKPTEKKSSPRPASLVFFIYVYILTARTARKAFFFLSSARANEPFWQPCRAPDIAFYVSPDDAEFRECWDKIRWLTKRFWNDMPKITCLKPERITSSLMGRHFSYALLSNAKYDAKKRNKKPFQLRQGAGK